MQITITLTSEPRKDCEICEGSGTALLTGQRTGLYEKVDCLCTQTTHIMTFDEAGILMCESRPINRINDSPIYKRNIMRAALQAMLPEVEK